MLTCHPGAIYGPSLVPRRALHPTSFNAILLASLHGRIPMFLSFPVTWVAAGDVASGSIARSIAAWPVSATGSSVAPRTR